MNALRVDLRINSGRIILNFGFQESLRTFLKPIFTGGVPTEKGCLPGGRQPFPEENKENTRPRGQSEYQNMLSSL